jgi:hypothetical protein
MSEPVARLLIELEDLTPRIWRRVDVPAAITLSALHDVIQTVMRWEYAHLYEFRVGDRIYGEPLPDMEHIGRRIYKARGVRLNQLIDRGVKDFVYVYDFGDNWQHRVTVEGLRAGDPGIFYPVLVDGARRAPPEDVGGVPGFMDFLEAITEPDHPDHAQVSEWAGGAFDPDDIEQGAIEQDLAIIAAFRRRALAGHRNRTSKKER